MKTGELEPKTGRELNDALELRNFSRYDYHKVIGMEETKLVIETTLKIIEFTNQKIKL